MTVEEFPNFFDWIGPAALVLLGIAVAAILLGTFFGYAVASFRHGPFEAFYVVAQVFAQAIPDLLGTAPRRVVAIGRLAIKEALRRRVILVTFAIFAITLLFGGWFMNRGTDHPDRVYVNFVLWGTQLLVLLMGMLISSFSLPEDIKNKTIYTVVTKPVRATEIVLGRIFGIGLLATALLALMGILSFLFVWRNLSHNHQIVGDTQTVASFDDIDPETQLDNKGRRVSPGTIQSAETTPDSRHRHRIEIVQDVRSPIGPQPIDTSNIIDEINRNDGKTVFSRVVVVPFAGHTHRISSNSSDETAELIIGPATGYFRARVPVYANVLQFHDRQGKLSRGIDIGKEWQYRGYVDGGNRMTQNSLSKAMFDFENFTSAKFSGNEIIPLEMTLGVFRTYKGDIEKRVIASIQFESLVEDESESYVSEPIIFETAEYSIQTLPITRKQPGQLLSPDGTVIKDGEFDLFDDFAANGKLRLVLRCEDFNQYLGVSRADLYFRAADDLYWGNFIKGYLGIWCQMMIVISLGVSLSTFLSAPVTMLATIVTIIVGFFTTFIRTMTQPDVSGGGPIESFFRLITQKNMESPLETGIGTTLMEQCDNGIVYILDKLTYLAPNFSQLNFSNFLTYGYSIDIHRLLVALSITFGFCVGLSVLGYFCLKTREIAK